MRLYSRRHKRAETPNHRTESSTKNPTSQTRKLTQGGIEDPSENNYKSKPPSSTSEGVSQGGISRETPKGEPIMTSNENCIPIKAIHQCRTSEGEYCRCIPIVTPTSAPIKTPDNLFQPSRNLAVIPKIGKLLKIRIGKRKVDIT